jgi:cytoskeletal protein RodZ
MDDHRQGRSRRWSMKTVVSFLATVVLSCILIGLAVAQQRSPSDTQSPPKGVEGPEIRKQGPKSTGGADTPKTEKKSPRARDQKPKDTPYPPTGTEGPEIRKQGPKSTGGADTPKTEKKSTPAKSQRPRHIDSPPKAIVEPELKQDSGKKMP